MNKPNKILDYATGKQDERERHETMQRLSNLVVCLYFLSLIVWAASMIFGLIALQQPEYRLGVLLFAVPTALIIAWGLYRSAKKHIQQQLDEWEN